MWIHFVYLRYQELPGPDFPVLRSGNIALVPEWIYVCIFGIGSVSMFMIDCCIIIIDVKTSLYHACLY